MLNAHLGSHGAVGGNRTLIVLRTGVADNFLDNRIYLERDNVILINAGSYF